MRCFLALCLLAMPGLTTPALAESPRRALFPTDGTCYLRHYGKDHLAKHPNQLVREIAIGPDPGSMEADVQILRVAVVIRDMPGVMQSYAYCNNAGGLLSCALEGDGGWFHLQPHPKGMKMTVEGEPLGLEGANGFVTFGGEASDDSAFILPPVPADSCP